MDDQNTQGNSLGGSTIDTLWTGLGLEVLLTFLSLILIQNNWQKQKSLVNLSTRAKNFGRGLRVLNCKAPITSAHPGPQRDRKQVLPSHFIETKVTNNSEFWGFFLESWSCGSAINPILFPYFLILRPNQKWDVFSTAVAQPRLVKLWLRWQDLLGLFSYYLQCKIPLQPIKEEIFFQFGITWRD